MSLLTKEQLFGTTGGLITGSLFWEERNNLESAVFTIAENPHPDYIAFKPLFLEHTVPDPTEYTFAMEVFGSWWHWVRINRNKKMRSYFDKCREERDVAIESLAIKEIIKESLEGKSRFQAAKFLAQKGYKQYSPQKSKYNKEQQIASDIDADLERLLAK